MSRTKNPYLVLEIEDGTLCPIWGDIAVLGRQGEELAVVQNETNTTTLRVQTQRRLGTLSRRHMRIRYYDGEYYVEDLRSTNGTLWNNLPLRPFDSVRLTDGDRLQLGSLRLEVRVAARRSVQRDEGRQQGDERISDRQEGTQGNSAAGRKTS